MKYDYLIVGAGLYGSVFSQQCKDMGLSVLVIDKRNHVGGNCYSENIDGIHVHKYGPHIFHTSNIDVWKYFNTFCETEFYSHVVAANYKNEIYSLPFNMFTFSKMWNITSPEEASEKINSQRFTGRPTNLEETALSIVGEDIYRKFIYGYTKKQWKKEPKELPSFIIKRLPFRLTYNPNYFNDPYQAMPKHGYGQIFNNLLDGIPVELGSDFLKKRAYWEIKAKKIIFTGPIDAYYDYEYGELEYRSLTFSEEKKEINNYQGVSIINYTDENVPYTRVVEHKHFNNSCKNRDSTVITFEYPTNYDKKTNTPYYPVNTTINNELYKKYASLHNSKVYFGGRLGKYRYVDMDQTIAMALNDFKKVTR